MTASRPALLVDIGNTRIKWAWCDAALPAPTGGPLPTPWRNAGAVSHATAGALATTWQALRDARASSGAASAPAVWISNVAGADAGTRVRVQVADAFGPAAVPVEVTTGSAFAGFGNGYRVPEQLGVDRWTGSIGAQHFCPRDVLLIVTAGTATTIDVVTPVGFAASDARGREGGVGMGLAGRFEGGLILPGLDLMMGSLARNTAQLPAVQRVEAGIGALAAGWADNTADAIAAGCLAAQAGAVGHMWRTLAARGPVRCLLSGGAREALARVLPLPFEMHENLVLLGLAVIAAQAGPTGGPGHAGGEGDDRQDGPGDGGMQS